MEISFSCLKTKFSCNKFSYHNFSCMKVFVQVAALQVLEVYELLCRISISPHRHLVVLAICEFGNRVTFTRGLLMNEINARGPQSGFTTLILI